MTNTMTNITNEQLEAWAGLGPWEWCENWLYVANYNEHPGPVLWYTANDDGVHAEPHNAALIATAPDLARLVLEKDAEIARYRRALVQIASEGDEIYEASMSDGCDGPALLDFAKSTANIAHSALVDRAIRQAMKETSDE